MDKEQIRQGLEKKLKGLGVPQEDIDKALLDYDTLAGEIDDVKALERFGEQLVENTAYKNNIAPDDGMDEYRKLFPEVWGTEPPSDKDIEDFLNEEIGNPNEKVTENPDGSTTREGPGYVVNENVPLEEFKIFTGGNPTDTKLPEWFDDIKDSPYYFKTQFQIWSMDGEYQDRKKFLNLIMQQYDIAFDYAKTLSPADKEILLKTMVNRTLAIDEKYKDITVKNDVDLSLQELDTFDKLIEDDAKNLKGKLQGMIDEVKLKDLEFPTNREKLAEIYEEMEWREAHEPTKDWPPDQFDDPGPKPTPGNIGPDGYEETVQDAADWEYERAMEQEAIDAENERLDMQAKEEELRASGDLEYGESINEEFDEIVNNERTANWWRYDGSSPEFQDYMERYTTGDLTDEELADLRSQNPDFAKDVDDYDQKVADAGQQFGVKDNALWSNMVKAGAKLLGTIDEEIIYSPLIMAQKGMKAMGIPGAGLLGTGISGILAYESILFKGMVGMAVLAHGTEMLKGEIERAPENLELIKENTIPAMSNAILGLFGMGMPEQLVQSHQQDLKPKSKEYEASVAEQGENHKQMLYNQAYLYSRVSPSLRFYTDVLGPKFGMYDQIGAIKKVANMGKKLGETRSYNQFGVND